MRKFIIFDIDQTLLYSGGAGIRAMNRAIEELTGVTEGLRGVPYAGRTDPTIVREALALRGARSDRETVDAVLDGYLKFLPEEADNPQAHLKPGVEELLRLIEGKTALHLGLLTGNIEQGARIKLGYFNLNPFFPVGAFGSDSEDRNALLPIVVRRLQQRAGVSIPYHECIIVGDTPLDVGVARCHGSKSIAVATGIYSLSDLEQTEADWVIPDFSDTDRIIEWIKAA